MANLRAMGSYIRFNGMIMSSLICCCSSSEFDLECACEGMSPAGGRLYSGRVSAFLSQHFKRMPDIRQACFQFITYKH